MKENYTSNRSANENEKKNYNDYLISAVAHVLWHGFFFAAATFATSLTKQRLPNVMFLEKTSNRCNKTAATKK